MFCMWCTWCPFMNTTVLIFRYVRLSLIYPSRSLIMSGSSNQSEICQYSTKKLVKIPLPPKNVLYSKFSSSFLENGYTNLQLIKLNKTHIHTQCKFLVKVSIASKLPWDVGLKKFRWTSSPWSTLVRLAFQVYREVLKYEIKVCFFLSHYCAYIRVKFIHFIAMFGIITPGNIELF